MVTGENSRRILTNMQTRIRSSTAWPQMYGGSASSPSRLAANWTSIILIWTGFRVSLGALYFLHLADMERHDRLYYGPVGHGGPKARPLCPQGKGELEPYHYFCAHNRPCFCDCNMISVGEPMNTRRVNKVGWVYAFVWWLEACHLKHTYLEHIYLTI